MRVVAATHNVPPAARRIPRNTTMRWYTTSDAALNDGHGGERGEVKKGSDKSHLNDDCIC